MISPVTGAVVIEDPGDPRVADYVGVTDAALRRRGAGVFLVEGELVLRRALDAGVALRSVLVTPPRLQSLGEELAGVGAPVYVAAQPVMNAVVGFDIHRGVLAAADRPPVAALDAVVDGVDRVAVVEGLTDHENLGAVFRNAAGLGVGAVVLDPRCADPLYRRCIRVSMGHVLSARWTRVEPWPDGLHELRRAGFTILALTPEPSASTLDEVVAEPGRRFAFLLGSEGSGLSPEAMATADLRVRIPMAGPVDSLNVATAAAIAFHQLRPR